MTRALDPARVLGVDLGFAEKAQIVDALLACPTLETQQGRDTVVKELGGNLSKAPRDPGPRPDCLGILNHCLQHNEGVSQLMEVIRFFDRDTIPLEKLESVIRAAALCVAVPNPDGAAGDLQHLVTRLMTQVTSAQVHPAYLASLPLDQPRLSKDAGLPERVKQLGSLPADATQLPPLVQFLERVAGILQPEPLAWELQNRNDERWGTGLLANQLRKLRKDVAANANGVPSYALVVRLVIEGANESNIGSYSAQIQLWRGNEPGKAYASVSGPGTLEAMDQALAGAIMEFCEDPETEDCALMVECWVPRALLCHPLDEVQLGGERRIGGCFPVVVRCSELWEDPLARRYCRRNWRDLRNLRKQADAVLLVRTPGAHTPVTLSSTLLERHNDPNGVVAVVFGFAPSTSGPKSEDLWSVLFGAGVPAALFTRGRPDTLPWSDVLAQLAQTPLAQLPRALKTWRLAATASDHWARNLALLWEDPERVPPKPPPLGPPRYVPSGSSVTHA